MKLEVGMYVRTFEGKIFKIQGLKDELIYVLNTECHFYKSLYGGDYCFRFPNENNHYTITKASHNIIDLIEVGDYINGELVTSAEDVYTTDNIYIGREVIIKHSDVIIEEEIETIVTREQFSAMEYRLGDK